MQEIPDKTTGNSYTANEFTTGIKTELQSVVSSTNQTFAEGNQTQLMQGLARLGGGTQLYTATGAVNAYSLTPANSFTSTTITAYFEGLVVNFIPVNTNTGASTVAVGALAATAVVDEVGNALVSGEIRKNTLVTLYYQNAQFNLLRPFGAPRIAGKFDETGTIVGIPTGFTSANVTVGPVVGSSREWVQIVFPVPFTNEFFITYVATYDNDSTSDKVGIVQGANTLTNANQIRFSGIDIPNAPAGPVLPDNGITFSISPNE